MTKRPNGCDSANICVGFCFICTTFHDKLLGTVQELSFTYLSLKCLITREFSVPFFFFSLHVFQGFQGKEIMK